MGDLQVFVLLLYMSVRGLSTCVGVGDLRVWVLVTYTCGCACVRHMCVGVGEVHAWMWVAYMCRVENR